MRLFIRWAILLVSILAGLCVFLLYIRNADDDIPIGRLELENDERSENAYGEVDNTDKDDPASPNYNIHTFYYPWYGSPEFDNGSWYHWNHDILTPSGEHSTVLPRHRPPGDIGANFYPQLGPYRDPAVLKKHMAWIHQAGIGCLAVSWYPPGDSTTQGHPWDDLMPTILDVADEHQLKVVFHIEPYKNRSVANLRENIAYIFRRYGKHNAFYTYKYLGRRRALFYIYDSYLLPDEDWKALLKPGGKMTVRGTDLDAHFIGLLVNSEHRSKLPANGFDGYYTYFATNAFTFGSTWKNWLSISISARRQKLIFIPCVGPGYIDVSIRPWNSVNARDREHGDYYNNAWKAAIQARPGLIGITSFNEWHEGTQIEPVVPKTAANRTYLDYAPQSSEYYLELTKKWTEKLNTG